MIFCNQRTHGITNIAEDQYTLFSSVDPDKVHIPCTYSFKFCCANRIQAEYKKLVQIISAENFYTDCFFSIAFIECYSRIVNKAVILIRLCITCNRINLEFHCAYSRLAETKLKVNDITWFSRSIEICKAYIHIFCQPEILVITYIDLRIYCICTLVYSVMT